MTDSVAQMLNTNDPQMKIDGDANLRAVRLANLQKAVQARNKNGDDYKPWTEADISNLTVWWLQGKLLKVICAKLERSQGSVLCKRQKLGLPKRRKGRKSRLNVELTEDAYVKLRRRAMERETTIAGYVRYLIARDIGEAP